MMNNLPWLFLLLPLVVAAIDWLCFSKCPRTAATLSILSAAATFALCCHLLFCGGACTPDAYNWLPCGGDAAKGLSMGLLLDDLALRMMLVVTGIGTLVHIFSVGYMKGDTSNLSRYFAGLSIFMFSMSTIVLADNLVMTFIGWEMVGFSSYLLIGHWFHKDSAADAAKKAFITNRVGDFGFLIGILMTAGAFGTLQFAGMGAVSAQVAPAVLTAVVLFLFCGAVGKSAQFPLHVWLPDAMEGPTPVSALIHAATMVAAGVYMLVRLQVSMGAGAFTETAATVIASVGAITAVMAAVIATQQDDIKRVLAYSTLSQLGYMVMAVGLLAGEAAMFHLYTHAWFKALLFLGAGAVIVCCHHEQDIWKMGGLAKRMPLTVLCFILGTAALIAIPGTSGFFSKEAILDAALEKSPVFFYIGAGVAALTTFYMTRLCLVAFLGKARDHGAEHAKEASAWMLLPLVILAVMAVIAGYGFVADELVPFAGFHAHGMEIGTPFFVSLGALVIGLLAAVIVYGLGKRSQDPLAGNCISTALRKRLYIDCFYDKVVIGFFQDKLLAGIIEGVDTALIRGILVQGLAWATSRVGKLLSWIQGGSLRGYALVTGLGLVIVVFLFVFFHQF
ncbi:MAG: NADH-quinone oxidoreductase subunit L [Akkermansia sp.]|nr:NADH-quinone oxidoreductase subunit L [Akkermansia sp.]